MDKIWVLNSEIDLNHKNTVILCMQYYFFKLEFILTQKSLS